MTPNTFALDSDLTLTKDNFAPNIALTSSSAILAVIDFLPLKFFLRKLLQTDLLPLAPLPLIAVLLRSAPGERGETASPTTGIMAMIMMIMAMMIISMMIMSMMIMSMMIISMMIMLMMIMSMMMVVMEDEVNNDFNNNGNIEQ